MQSKHDDVVDIIRRNPHQLGIEDVVVSTDEVIFFDGRRYVTSPDSLIFTKKREIFVIEYKSSDNKRSRNLGQLNRHMDATRDYFNASEIYGLYIHGPEKEFTIEVI